MWCLFEIKNSCRESKDETHEDETDDWEEGEEEAGREEGDAEDGGRFIGAGVGEVDSEGDDEGGEPWKTNNHIDTLHWDQRISTNGQHGGKHFVHLQRTGNDENKFFSRLGFSSWETGISLNTCAMKKSCKCNFSAGILTLHHLEYGEENDVFYPYSNIDNTINSAVPMTKVPLSWNITISIKYFIRFLQHKQRQSFSNNISLTQYVLSPHYWDFNSGQKVAEGEINCFNHYNLQPSATAAAKNWFFSSNNELCVVQGKDFVAAKLFCKQTISLLILYCLV